MTTKTDEEKVKWKIVRGLLYVVCLSLLADLAHGMGYGFTASIVFGIAILWLLIIIAGALKWGRTKNEEIIGILEREWSPGVSYTVHIEAPKADEATLKKIREHVCSSVVGRKKNER